MMQKRNLYILNESHAVLFFENVWNIAGFGYAECHFAEILFEIDIHVSFRKDVCEIVIQILVNAFISGETFCKMKHICVFGELLAYHKSHRIVVNIINTAADAEVAVMLNSFGKEA